MPVYTYRREDGSTFDIRQKFLDDPLDTCPTTGQKVVRVVQPAGIIFKGGGFYVTDTKGANNPAKPSNTSSDSGSNDSGSETPSSEKKEKLTPDKVTPIPEKPGNSTASAAANQ